MTNQTQANTESTSEPRQPECGTELAAAPTKPQRAPRKGKADRKTPTAHNRARPKTERKPAAAKTARSGSKAAKILDLLKQPHGASLKELRKATGWQAHSIRGFLSGTIRKKMGLKVISAKSKEGERSYRVKA